MPATRLLLLRELKNKPRSWTEPRTWPAAPDLPADRLVDLDTSSNELSLFSCEPDHLPNAKTRIAAALVAKRVTVKTLTWIVVPLELVTAAGYEVVRTPNHGNSADAEVNKGHHDIRNLTARKLVQLLEMLTPLTEDDGFPRLESVESLALARELREAENSGRYTMTERVRGVVDDLLREDPA